MCTLNSLERTQYIEFAGAKVYLLENISAERLLKLLVGDDLLCLPSSFATKHDPKRLHSSLTVLERSEGRKR
jgi:hypothetical protein